MGKKSKNTFKNTKNSGKTHASDASNRKMSERRLEEFEKSIATMIESLNSKKIEVIRTYAYNSKSDPTTMIGKINAKCLLDDDESVESLQQKIMTAANIDAYLNTKLVTVKSTTSSDTTNSSQDEVSKKGLHNAQNHETPIKAQQGREKALKPRRLAHSGPLQNKYQKQSITPPQRMNTGISDLKKCLSDKKKYNTAVLEKNFYVNEEEFITMKSEGLNKSFSHFQSYKELIEMKPNIYIKANKHFIIDELSLENILQKIYFEAYSYKDLKEYVFSALRKISSLDDFLDILYISIRDYSLRVREHIMERLEEVIIKTKRLVKGNNGYSEIVHEFGGYKKFSKHCVTYTGIVNKIYEAYKSLEMITIEIEKVCALYFNAFCKERVRFSCSDFHKRVFMKYFYNDPWVKDFLETISRYFEERHFYASKYPTAVSQILELGDCLNRLQQYDPNNQLVIESIDEKGYERPNGLEEDDEISREPENERVRVSLTVREALFKKMMQTNSIEGLCIDDEECQEEEIEAVITKSKKKKNKKKKNKDSKKNNETDINANEMSTGDKHAENKAEKENIPCNKDKKRDFMKGIKQNTGNVKLDNEVEAFEKRLDFEIDQANLKQEKIKPNISDEWVQTLRQRLHKMNKL